MPEPQPAAPIDDKQFNVDVEAKESCPVLMDLLMRGTTGLALGPNYDWIGDGQNYCS